MTVYLVLWLTLLTADAPSGVVSSHATGGGAVAVSSVGAPVTVISFSTRARCEGALQKITSRAPFVAGVCVAQ